MKPLLMVATAAVLFAPMHAAARDAAIAAPIQAMMAGFNKGDVAAVKALHVAEPTIIDNVPPFRWAGAGAFDSWLADLSKDEAAAGKTGGQVVFGATVAEYVAGDRAYVVTPCSYSFKQHGKRMREAGFTSFVLVKDGAAWKVESWSWASPTAVPVK